MPPNTSLIFAKAAAFLILQAFNHAQMKARHDLFHAHSLSLEPLWDLLHHCLPAIEITPAALNTCLALFFVPWMGNDVSESLPAYVDLWLTLMILRSITTLVTALPPSKRRCLSDHHPLFGGCFDKVFSGHTVTAFLAVLVAQRFGFITNQGCIVWSMLAACYGFLIVIAREHYTIDVILSFVLAWLVTRSAF